MQVFGAKFWYATFGSSTKKLNNCSRLAKCIGSAERSRGFKLLDAKTHTVGVSKVFVFNKIAELFLSLEKSGITISIYILTHYIEVSLVADSSGAEDEDEMTLERWTQAKNISCSLRMRMKMILSML